YGSERRRHPRHVVDLPTHIVINGRKIGCRLVDVSRGGALVAAPATVTVGDRVLLEMPGQGDVVATLVRTTPITFPLAFAGRIVLSMAGDGDDGDGDGNDGGEAHGNASSRTFQDVNPRRLM